MELPESDLEPVSYFESTNLRFLVRHSSVPAPNFGLFGSPSSDIARKNLAEPNMMSDFMQSFGWPMVYQNHSRFARGDHSRNRGNLTQDSQEC